jgi:LysM repeat protein
MDFQELFDRYKQLREDFDAGRIDEEEFQDEIEGLQLKDEQGWYWTIGAQSGKWYRYDGNEWIQETPLPMTKHQGRGIPEMVSRLTAPRADGSSFMPRWIYTGCAGFILLVVVVLLGVVLINFVQQRGGVRIGQAPTPTLSAGLPQNTPTPAPTPSETPTLEPTPTRPTLKSYSNSVFGFSIEYPGGWQVRELERQVILAPEAAGLATTLGDEPMIKSVALAVYVEGGGIVDTSQSVLSRILAGLPVDPSSSETGTRAVNGVEWAISQVKLNATDRTGDMIAYVAATVYNNSAYSVVAAAPATAWNEQAPVFQRMFDSLRFTAPQAGVTTMPPPTTTVTSAVAAVRDMPTPRSTATSTPTQPSGTPTPVVYVVKSGDTLLAIATQYNVTVADLQAANGIEDPSKLSIGQQLIIPVGGYVPSGGSVTATAVATGTATPRVLARTTLTATVAATTTIAPDENAATPAVTASPGEPPATVAVVVEPTATVARPTPTPPAEVPLSGKIVYPVFAPERTLQGQPGSYDIYMSDPQGTNPQLLVYNASQPALNTGGDLLAYKSWDPTARGLAFMTIGGGRSGVLTKFIEDALPYWDPSSITMVFTSRREGDRVPRLFRVNQANNQESGFGIIAEYASVFPDGRIVYRGCTVEGACGIFVVGPEGVGGSQITNNSSDTAPAPSPDGSRIAFMSFNRDGAGNYEIFVMDSSGSNVVRLTNNAANDGLPTWSPDGTTIAFVSDRDGRWGVWAMNPDGSNQRKLFTMQGSPDGVIGSELSSSRGWLEERISWSR